MHAAEYVNAEDNVATFESTVVRRNEIESREKYHLNALFVTRGSFKRDDERPASSTS
jgi:hypothetical protein